MQEGKIIFLKIYGLLQYRKIFDKIILNLSNIPTFSRTILVKALINCLRRNNNEKKRTAENNGQRAYG